MNIYQHDPDREPDDLFEPGDLHHLVPGNTGRLMDARRTPVVVVGLRPEAGFVRVEIRGFEDTGAVWETPLEKVGHYQFRRGEPRADAESVELLGEIIERCAGPGDLPADAAMRVRTQARLEALTAEAGAWIAGRPGDPLEGVAVDAGAGETDPRLWTLLEAWMEEADLAGVESAFSRQWVSNPYSGDLVYGHRVVLAELGLVAYEDRRLRDPEVFEHPWTREQRAGHLLRRMAFVRALFPRLGLSHPVLFRGMTLRARLEPPANGSLIAATFDRRVAQSHFDLAPEDPAAVLFRQTVPMERIVMTFIETRAMNAQFREAEAVLLFAPGNPMF